MGWTTTEKTYQAAGSPYYYINWAGIADATDLADAAIVDLSALTYDGTNAPTKARVVWAKMSAGGVMAYMEYNEGTDVLILACPPGCTTEITYKPHGDIIHDGLYTGVTAGAASDIIMTTTGGAVGEGIYLSMIVELLAS